MSTKKNKARDRRRPTLDLAISSDPIKSASAQRKDRQRRRKKETR